MAAAVSPGTGRIDPKPPAVFDQHVSDQGPVAAVRRQVRAVRRRHNLHVVQYAVAVAVAVTATAGTLVVLGALRGGRTAFALVALAGGAIVCGATGLLLWHAARRWLRAADAPARIDAARGLRGRVASVTELTGRTESGLYALLLRQNRDALPRWRPEDVVPEVVPAVPFACAVGAIAVLLAVLVFAPALRAPPPRVVVGDRAGDYRVARERDRDDAERLLVAPGTDHTATDGGAGGAAADDAESGFADATASLQDWLQHALGVEEPWEGGDQAPPAGPGEATREPQRAARRGSQRAAGAADASGEGAAGERPAGESAGEGRPGDAENDPGGGGSGEGAGAGSETDPALYGAPRDGAAAGPDRFELAIAARVRTRRGTPMNPWTTAPGRDADRRPALAGVQRTEQPGHRMAVPAPFAPLVRRLYAHAPAVPPAAPEDAE